MPAAQADSASLPAEMSLENPNAPLVIIGQVLCILVPPAVWFGPLPLVLLVPFYWPLIGLE